MSDYRTALDRLVGWAAFFHDAQTLRDLAQLSIEDLMRQSGILDVADAISLDQPADSVVSALEVGSTFAAFFDSLCSRRQLIALRRTFADEPEVLEALGFDFGVSRERARQLEADVKKAFRKMAAARFMNSAIRLRKTLPMVLPTERLDALLDPLIAEAPSRIQTAARFALLQHIGYVSHGGMSVSREFREMVDHMRGQSSDYADQHGIIDEEGLRAAIQIEGDDVWQLLTESAGLQRVRGQLVVRDTREVRLVLALRELGKPATREQLAEMTGLELRSAAGVLSGSQSFVRTTKDTWGLEGWTDDPYEGAVTEIIQRIQAGGGEASIGELMIEIPTRFGVSPGTVQAYLGTPKFSVEGDVVRLAQVGQIDAVPLSSLREIIWTAEGQPVLRVRVAEHHLAGVSIKVPPSVAVHLGVGPDSDTMVPVSEPKDCPNVSVIWRAHDPNGPELGRLREALLALNAGAGTEVFIVLDPSGLTITTDGTGLEPVQLGSKTKVTESDYDHPAAPTSPALERMKLRRRF